MKFRRQRRDELSVNLTPLIDVVFLLLIFFMVSTSFTRATQLAVNLPEAEGQPAPERTAKLELVIAADGVFTLNGREISSQPIDVRRALRDESNGNRDMPEAIPDKGEWTDRKPHPGLWPKEEEPKEGEFGCTQSQEGPQPAKDEGPSGTDGTGRNGSANRTNRMTGAADEGEVKRKDQAEEQRDGQEASQQSQQQKQGLGAAKRRPAGLADEGGSLVKQVALMAKHDVE